MSDDEGKLHELVLKYLHNTAPIHWVNWAARCTDADAKRALNLVLFRDGRLRDLTNDSVRVEVLHTISNLPGVMELVIADFADEVGKQE